MGYRHQLLAVLACTILLAGLVTSLEMPTVTLTVDHSLVQPGDAVSFTCRLTGFPTDATAVLRKSVHQLEPKAVLTEVIARGDVLEAPYSKTERYSVTRYTEGADDIFKLSIEGVQTADTGAIECEAQHAEHGPVIGNVVLEVYKAPVADAIHHNQEGDTVTLVEDQPFPSYYLCSVPNVMPVPKMELWITDDESLSPMPHADPAHHAGLSSLVDKWRNATGQNWRDITDKFLLASEQKLHCAEQPGAKEDCPLHVDYNVTANSTGYRANILHNGKQLTCLATMRVFDKASVNVSLKLIVNYKPRIICERHNPIGAGVIHLPLNATNQKVTCRVFSNPAPQSVTWQLGNCADQNPVTVPEGEIYDTKTFDVDFDQKNRTVELTIKVPLTKEFFATKNLYCLTAGNEIGDTKREITLKETPPHLVGDSGSIMTSSVALTAALSLIAAARGEGFY